MKIYLIPGLGYTDQIFSKLNFGNLKVEYIKWIEPIRNESIHQYSKRLFANINENEEEIILIGHSLGAIVSQEIATIKNIHKIILISSIKSRAEMSLSFKLIKPLKLYKLFTKELSIKTIKYWGKSHGFENHEEHQLFKSMVAKQSNHYLQWALKSLSSWQSPNIPKRTQLFQIHGTKDKTFPIGLIRKPYISIVNGSHIMVFKQAKKMSEIIISILSN